MTKRKKITIWLIVLLPLLFVGYLAFNGWHLYPGTFRTYSAAAKDITGTDTSKWSIQYRQYCGGCHGIQANKFANGEWKFGKTKSAIFKAIKYGDAKEGMPAFES